MPVNEKCPSGNFGDILQLTNWILDYVAMCHMTPEVSDFITGSFYKIWINTLNFWTGIMSQQGKKGQVRIKMCDDNGDPFIATLHNVLLVPDLYDRLFSIVTLMNLGNNCLFHKGFCTVYFVAKEKNKGTLPHSAQRIHAFLG